MASVIERDVDSMSVLGVSRSVLLLLLVVVVAAGCGAAAEDDETLADGTADDADGTTDDGGPAELDIEALVGSSWSLRFGGGPEGDIQLVDGWPITLTFDEDTLGGTAACNGYGSSYTIEGSRLRLGDLGQTEMGCRADVQEAERTYLAALADVDGINLVEDELALSGLSTELIFGRNVAVPVDELVGMLWLLEATSRDGMETPVGGEPATLRLEPDGTFAGGSGCRSLSGRYTVFGNGVHFNEFGADGDCPKALFDQDSSVVEVLGDGFVPVIDGETLTLTSAGNAGLRYRATTEDEVAGLTGRPVPSDAELLDGVEWIFVGGDSPDGPIIDPRTVDPAQGITLALLIDRYSGTAFCNEYGGEAEIGNGRLVLGVPSAEEEGCGEAVDAIAAAYYDALPLMTEFGVEADGAQLVANGSGVELWFERAG